MAAPPTFADILGQHRAISLLCDSMRTGRVHHAWIFHGPQGVGKHTTATAFATALLDPTTSPRGDGLFVPEADSDTQRLIGAGSHPDFFLVRKELALDSRDPQIRTRKQMTIPKQVIDEFLCEPAHMKPALKTDSIKSRVFVVDEAEILGRGAGRTAQNALLKTLEEPPDGVVIILVTTSEEALLPTIRSRCQSVAFRSLDDEAMAQWQQREGMRTDDPWLLDFAAGSPGRLHMALGTSMQEWGGKLEPLVSSAERGVYSADFGATLGKLVDDWAKEWEKNHKNASKDAANKAGASHMLAMLEERARRRLNASATSGDAIDEPLRWIDLIEEARSQIGANVNFKQAMANLGAQLARTDGRPVSSRW